MPKLLIIGGFPPQSDVGCLRPAMMAKYLPKFGWETYVLAPAYGEDHVLKNDMMSLINIVPDDHIIRVAVTAKDERDYLHTRGFLGKVRDTITIEKAFPPGVFGKLWAATKMSYMNIHFDAIWATAPNFPHLRVGRDLSLLRDIPWIADFRDITEQDERIDADWRIRLLYLRAKLRRKMLVQNTACLTSVSSFHCQTLAKKTGKRCELIYNGYDSALFKPQTARQTEKFRIVYMGRILAKHIQNPTIMFEALDALLSEGLCDAKNIDISFYATEKQIVKDIAGHFHSWKLCKFQDRVDYIHVPDILSNASVLLLLTDYTTQGILTTKLFEYLAIERPILCVRTEPDSEIADIINKANSGYAGDNLASVKSFILHYYHQWQAQGYCSVALNINYVKNFTREEQAKKLAVLLDDVIALAKRTS